MPLTPGFSPNIRESAPEPATDQFESADVDLGDALKGASGTVVEIEHDDGSITISLDGTSLAARDTGPKGWWDNLAEDIDAGERSRIADDLLRAVGDDIASRREWIESRKQGLRLLGLQLELPGANAGSDQGGVAGISTVRHPLLLEAVLRFQANARSELLPTDGPAKVRQDGAWATQSDSDLADALEADLNHFLTSTATEYYPDTDRMLLMLGFGGMSFKKGYFCPLRGRPVLESVDADDLIVNANATDLANARRITHRTDVKPSTVKRLQILGVYRDLDLPTPTASRSDGLKQERQETEGIRPAGMNPYDLDREIYECYCELDLKGFEHRWKGKVTGLEVPYRVTIDVSSREVLSIVRNYDQDTEQLPVARTAFIDYTFVPGLHFYGIGLLHILGNTTNAITAAWRELLDAGMYANFPGFLISDTAGRQNTNIFRIPPGGGASIKTGGMAIQQAVMPLPYKEPSPALMQLVDSIAATGQRVGGTSELQVGEGKQEAPVGTTLALIEQATKILNSVHKRMHESQSRELKLLVRLFKENPKSFWQHNRKPAYRWDQEVFLKAVESYELVPQADPNTASHTQRVMKIQALKQLQAAQPALYDPIAIDKVALRAIGFQNPEQFMAPPQAQAAPPPELLQAQAQIRQGDVMAQAAKTSADARMLDAQTKAREAGLSGAEMKPEGESKGLTSEEFKLRAASEITKAHQVDLQGRRLKIEDVNRDKDRAAKIEVEKMRLQGDAMAEQRRQQHETQLQQRDAVAQHIHDVAATPPVEVHPGQAQGQT